MNHIEIMDCTLRDGGYLVNKEFGDTVIKGIVDGLVTAGIDYIEVGFLQNEGFGEGRPVFRNTKDSLPYLPKDRRQSRFALLADYSRYSAENLNEYIDGGIDAVRECFFKSESQDAMGVCRDIQDKGYKLFIQPVDILGYSDKELLELIDRVNDLEPFCFSIVDTFGSMYQEDLHRVFELIHHNLTGTCRMGFHSHNNMQLSNALSQAFMQMSFGKRKVIIDGTLAGMGRGAGNTPTELAVQYACSHFGGIYDLDAILDILDSYMDYLKSRCSWGYSTQNLVAGMYGTHVNNVAYLLKKNSIRSREIRQILSAMGEQDRKRYDYSLLDRLFGELNRHKVDDSRTMEKLREGFSQQDLLVLAPGNSLATEKEKILDYIAEKKPVVISINFPAMGTLVPDYAYFSNLNRYFYWSISDGFASQKRILASNIKEESENEEEFIVSFDRLVGRGEYADNSTIMLLKLLDAFDISSIALAGFDGYSSENKASNYAMAEMELENVLIELEKRNDEIGSMLTEYMAGRTKDTPIFFITDSKFCDVLKGTTDTFGARK